MNGISQRQVLDAIGRVRALSKPYVAGVVYDDRTFSWNDAIAAAYRELLDAFTTEEDA